MHIAAAQLNYKIGDFAGNFALINQVMKDYANQVDLIVFSELCLSGYYPRDLITHDNFIQEQNVYFDKIVKRSLETNASVIIGYIACDKKVPNRFYNSLALISKGEHVYTYHKRLLPVYNIFDEARHFAAGKKPGIFQWQGLNLGFLICEDGWVGLAPTLYECNPIDDLAKEKLDVIICINGSPSNVGKQADRLLQFSGIAKRCLTPLLFVNQVGGNDDIVFDGSSFILDRTGKPIAALPAFQEAIGVFDVAQKQLKPSAPFGPYQEIDPMTLFYEQTILGLADYVKKCGFKQVVIGISGGIDSALTLALAVKALGAANVIGLAMPSRYSSSGSLTDAQHLCEIVGVKLFVFSIEEEFTLVLARFEQVYGEKATSLTEQNIQARIRGRLLMEYSNQTGALVLSTGNKSELSVGYTTLYGDMTGGFNLIGDLYKTDVYALSEYYNQCNPTTAIPSAILKKAPSAELALHQKDVDTLPEYDILDPILKLYIEGDLLPKAQMQQYQDFLQTLSPSVIARVQQMVDKAEFKRRQASPIVRVQRRAFGHGRQFPIAATYPTPKT